NARSISTSTTTGGNPDFFIDLAVPWSALVPLGLDRTTRTYVWAGSSSAADRLDGDLACHDGGSGPANLDGTASDQTTGDPAQDPNTTHAELAAQFGDEVAAIVGEVTDDKSQTKDVRKQAQIEHAAQLSPRAKLVKLADKICNLRDIASSPPAGWPLERKQQYFD